MQKVKDRREEYKKVKTENEQRNLDNSSVEAVQKGIFVIVKALVVRVLLGQKWLGVKQ